MGVTLFALAGCGSDGPTEEAGLGRIELTAGGSQSSMIGTPLPNAVLVRVVDGNDRPVSGAIVRFTVPQGAGTTSPSSAATNAVGEAATNWTLGPAAGEQTLTVTTTGATDLVVTATASPGSASRLELRSTTPLTGTVGAALPAPVVVRLVDDGGNPIPGETLRFFIESGEVSPVIATTNAAGEASITWTLGTTAGPQRLDATYFTEEGTVRTLEVFATAAAGPAARFAFVTENLSAPSATAIPAAVLVTDAHGNPVAGSTVAFGIGLGDGTVSPAQGVTGADGRATATWTLGTTAGTQRLRASVVGLPGESLTTATVTAPLRVLAHRVVDAEYSPATDRIVTVSASPSQLHVIDPATGETRSVALPNVPVAVSVRLDGQYAAVAHDAFVSYVNLVTAALERTYATTTDAADVVLASNGYAYVFPRTDQWVSVHSVNLATGLETRAATISAGTLARLHPSGDFIYGANNGLSPSDFEKYDIRTGPARMLYDSPYHGDHAFNGNIWISDDGARLFARSGDVFRSSPVQAEDMRYAGNLEGLSVVQSLADSKETGRIVALPAGGFNSAAPAEFRVYDASFLAFRGVVGLPTFPKTTNGTTTYVPAEGRFVFMNEAGTNVYVLVRAQASAGLAQDWGLGVYPASVLP